MTKTQITLGVREVIAQNSRYTLAEVKTTDPIDKFITSFMKAKLAGQLTRKFKEVNTTALTNVLFNSVKKISQLIDHINNIYNPEA